MTTSVPEPYFATILKLPDRTPQEIEQGPKVNVKEDGWMTTVKYNEAETCAIPPFECQIGFSLHDPSSPHKIGIKERKKTFCPRFQVICCFLQTYTR